MAAGINDFFGLAVDTAEGTAEGLRLQPGPRGPRTQQQWVDSFEALIREVRRACLSRGGTLISGEAQCWVRAALACVPRLLAARTACLA
jgi:hypothetical protein